MKNRDEVLMEIEQVFGTSRPEDLIRAGARRDPDWTYEADDWYLECAGRWRFYYGPLEFDGDTLREAVDAFHEYLFRLLRATGCEVEVTSA